MIVISPKAGTESATALAEMLGCKYENPYETGNRNFKGHGVVLKYGFSKKIETDKNTVVLNKAKSVALVLDKIKTFELFKEDDFFVPFTKSINEAMQWLKMGATVVARETATGHDSEGILFCDTIAELKLAPAVFWTPYIGHTHEFRVNCWRDEVVSIYEKAEREEDTLRFRFNLFQGQEKHPQLVNMCEKIYKKTGLDWYGIDVLRTDSGDLIALEINSAPILFPFTMKRLAEKLKGLGNE